MHQIQPTVCFLNHYSFIGTLPQPFPYLWPVAALMTQGEAEHGQPSISTCSTLQIQTTTDGNFLKYYIVADVYYVLLFFSLSLFPEQYSITTIFIVFTLYYKYSGDDLKYMGGRV